MSLHRIEQGQDGYPDTLIRYLGRDAPVAITMLGNATLLDAELTALFVSVRCPGNLILKLHGQVEALRDAGTTVISGFHTPVEQHCLTLLLRGTQPVVTCPARGLAKFRMPAAWRPVLEADRLLLLSAFPGSVTRATAATAMFRNQFVAALADQILVGHAEPGGDRKSVV